MMILGMVVVLLLVAEGAFAQPTTAATDGASEVLALEKQVERAVLRADIEYLDAVCASDFTYTHGDGWTTGSPILGVDTKSEWLASLPGRYAMREVDSQLTATASRGIVSLSGWHRDPSSAGSGGKSACRGKVVRVAARVG
jgi:hypothetical protein